MDRVAARCFPVRLTSSCGLRLEINANGSVRRFDFGSTSLTLFPGSELEGGLVNIYLRRRDPATERPTAWTALLGPASASSFRCSSAGDKLHAWGRWHDVAYSLTLVMARSRPGWFWHVRLENAAASTQVLDLTYVQDLALAPYGAVRMNEYYISQYVDHTPLHHAVHGVVVASRQNQAVDGRFPWSMIASLNRGASFATDALQFFGLERRRNAEPPGLAGDLPGKRLQHEHSLVAIRDASITLEPGQSSGAGFFGACLENHAEATSAADLRLVEEMLALPEAAMPREAVMARKASAQPEPRVTANDAADAMRPSWQAGAAASLFCSPALLECVELDVSMLQDLFGSDWRHEERDEGGRLLSFFHGTDRHVVLRRKELSVRRPHGHLLRSGTHLTPAEASLTSTVWMSGVFHSMLTQGHVNINRFLSTVRGYLSLFRAQGLRIFVEISGEWRLLDVPSAFEVAPGRGRWLYHGAEREHGTGCKIEISAAACREPSALELSVHVEAGGPLRFLLVLHVALDGDDGAEARRPRSWLDDGDVVVAPAPQTELGQRFPNGSFRISANAGLQFEHVGGDEHLFLDGVSRDQPYLCIVTAPLMRGGLRITGKLIEHETQAPLRLEDLTGVFDLASRLPAMQPAPTAVSELRDAALQLADIVPWFTDNALVHYLSPRGLEQFSGGGWGTRDVCQGPVELLLALGLHEPIRDLLVRVMGAQNRDGDWPQWFMFFERENRIRAGDSHGDIVFWPLVVLAQYLLATGDADVLEQRAPFFDGSQPSGQEPTLWAHVRQALSLIERRVIAGTTLAAYGHGDWNDSLQPADPQMRDHLCSAWTVTLHVQALRTLARALRAIGRLQDATPLEQWAERVQRDFRRFFLVDGVVAGYASFGSGGDISYLLHPRDRSTVVRYSALAMIHAILEDMLEPSEARSHVDLIEKHLSGPDGLRLFDRPMEYHGGPQRFFQRAESATFFGREIGLMYVHAHLRYAQALAHMGEAERFFRALRLVNPIGIRLLVPQANYRQSNCYFSSSDAAFADRYQASLEYERVRRGTIEFDGGWRVYSSGAGIAVGLIMRRFLGLSHELTGLRVDPVMPPGLDGLQVETAISGRAVLVTYHVGRAGCGVTELRLNGGPLPFRSEANPHRRGAALVARDDLETRLASGCNALHIVFG
jgi:cellobiose phosphorylase